MSGVEDCNAPQSLRLAKRALREKLRLAKRGMTEADRREQSDQICLSVLASSIWTEAESILLYSPLGSEVGVNSLIENGLREKKFISLPRYEPSDQSYVPCAIRGDGDVVEGAFGVREPSLECVKIDPSQLDLVIVPGVGFDALGTRLGRGGGHYDRLLRGLTATICGVCFRQQVLPRIPEEAHDIKMDRIATPDGWLIGSPE